MRGETLSGFKCLCPPTQGSSFLPPSSKALRRTGATLGWRTQSLWDCKPKKRKAALRASIVLLFSACVGQAVPTAEQVEFFENKVRPIFAEHCYSCHSQKAEKLKGGLRLDSADTLLKGGTTGPAIIRGEPDKSLLIKAVRYTDPDLQMPPKNKKLSSEQIATLDAWC